MRRLRLAIPILLIALLLTGCGALMGNLSPEVKPYAVFQNSQEVFNRNVRIYLDTRKTMSEEIQARWKVEIEPYLDRADAALTAWEKILQEGMDGTAAKEIYDKLFVQFLSLLIHYNIVEVK